MRDVMIRFAAVLSANPAPASANTRPRQKLRFGDLAREIARSVLTIVLFDNERGGRWEGGEVPISWLAHGFILFLCTFLQTILLKPTHVHKPADGCTG